jgi:ribonuclease D
MRVKKPVELLILKELAAWREREARSRDVPRSRVLKDETIYEIAGDQPADAAALGNLRSLSKGMDRSRQGDEILAIVRRAQSTPRDQMPAVPKAKVIPEGSLAAVDLMKVLLKLVAEKNGVAAKIIATVDELEAIAIDDDADVPALTGWRRQFFGEQALQLKRGELALTFDGKRVVVRPIEATPRGKRG